MRPRGKRERNLRELSHLSEIFDKYETFIIDLWGVIHNGIKLNPKAMEVIDNLNKGKNVLFDIDWQGADQIKNKKLDYKLITFFILPPSKEVLFQRLSNRHMGDRTMVEERMNQFSHDVLHWINYDYVVINDTLNNCFSKIINLIDAELKNGSKDYDKDFIRKHVEKLTV